MNQIGLNNLHGGRPKPSAFLDTPADVSKALLPFCVKMFDYSFNLNAVSVGLFELYTVSCLIPVSESESVCGSIFFKQAILTANCQLLDSTEIARIIHPYSLQSSSGQYYRARLLYCVKTKQKSMMNNEHYCCDVCRSHWPLPLPNRGALLFSFPPLRMQLLTLEL